MTQVQQHPSDVRPAPSAPASPPRSRPGADWAAPQSAIWRGWLLIGVAVAMLAVAVVTVAARPTPRMTVHGFVTVYGLSGFQRPGSDCAQPLYTGRPVTVFDEDGNVLGATVLTGRGVAVDRWQSYAGGYADACRYAVTIPDVSAAAGPYTVAVGTAPADGVGFDLDQLQSSTVDVPYGHA
jgi:hypothetical protein